MDIVKSLLKVYNTSCIWLRNLNNMFVQSGPEKIAQSLMHCHSATVCSRIMQSIIIWLIEC